MTTALIFGASGQAGRFLHQLLVTKGYDVHTPTHHVCNITKLLDVDVICRIVKPDEVYNFAGVTDENKSWENPRLYMDTNATGVANILKVYSDIRPDGKFFNAGSASVFDTKRFFHDQQSETSPRHPSSPYGVSKLAAEQLVKLYREKGFFCCTGIFFNMESEYRNSKSFTREATLKALEVTKSKGEMASFGNLSAIRDWGLAKEYVEAAWLMLQAEQPDDYVIGTGEAHSCLEFVELAFRLAGVPHQFQYKESFMENNKRDMMCADPYWIKKILGWKAQTHFSGVVRYMLDAAKQEVYGQSIVTR